MVVVITQDRLNIINAETIDRIYVKGKKIYAETAEATIILGVFEKTENITKILNYIAISLASAKTSGRAIFIPSEEVASNDSEIARKYVEAMKEKKKEDGVKNVSISPELKKIIDKVTGGDK